MDPCHTPLVHERDECRQVVPGSSSSTGSGSSSTGSGSSSGAGSGLPTPSGGLGTSPLGVSAAPSGAPATARLPPRPPTQSSAPQSSWFVQKYECSRHKAQKKRRKARTGKGDGAEARGPGASVVAVAEHGACLASQTKSPTAAAPEERSLPRHRPPLSPVLRPPCTALGGSGSGSWPLPAAEDNTGRCTDISAATGVPFNGNGSARSALDGR